MEKGDNKEIKLGLYGIKETFKKDIDISNTKFYKGSLRSGNKIEFEGSIVIIGDVNAGSEVIAGENIAVVGVLRGLAHAGAQGNKSAIISANEISSPQIRIADKILELQTKIDGKDKTKKYIYIDEKDEIVIE